MATFSNTSRPGYVWDATDNVWYPIGVGAHTHTAAAVGAIANTLTTTTGDIIYASAANTPARLGIGSTDQVLTVSSGVPAWATPITGGMTLLSTTSMTGNSTITVTGIVGTYNQLFIELIDAYNNTGGGVTVRFNSDSTANAYQEYFAEPGANQVYPTATPWYYTQGTSYSWTTGSYKPSDTNAYSSIRIENYANTSTKKQLSTMTSFQNNGSNEGININMGYWNNTAAITSISVIGAGTWTQGSLKIWGIK